MLVLVAVTVMTSDPVVAITHEDLVCPARESWSEGADECPCQKGWKPSPQQLKKIGEDHKHWLYRVEYGLAYPRYRGSSRRAVLCNADLRPSNLHDANLGMTVLRRADLRGAQLNCAIFYPSDPRANLSSPYIRKAAFKNAVPLGTNLDKANLSNVLLPKAELERSYLQEIDVGPETACVNLSGADFRGATLRGADLSGANLTNANFARANLQEANLSRTELQEANLVQANIENARFAFAKLHRAKYSPASPPPNGYLEGIEGLETVTFPYGGQTGLVQLRQLLHEAGLRGLERQATFAIEHGKAFHARQRHKATSAERLSGWLQLILFEWTTEWGLHPGRALLIMLGLMLGLSVVYAIPIFEVSRYVSKSNGIVRVYPAERIVETDEGYGTAELPKIERLHARGPFVYAWAVYFSMLVAFHIGWRDLNVGTWISRIQPTEFALRARGWVRVVSGAQSLISVYLIAIWALTYFGRPFQ